MSRRDVRWSGLAVVVAVLAGCTGTGDVPGEDLARATDDVGTGSDSDVLGGGVPAVLAPTGPGCADLPATGPGSVQQAAGLGVPGALAADPTLARLAAGLGAIGFTGALEQGEHTVLAPTDTAFAALPGGRADALFADPAGELVTVLLHHVLPGRYDAAQLLAAGTVTTLAGTDLTVTGSPDALQVNGVAVECGGISTTGGTLFTLDAVLALPGS